MTTNDVGAGNPDGDAVGAVDDRARSPQQTLIPEYLEHRPTYAGMAVPYVAIWSDERDPNESRLARWRGIDWIYTDKRSGVPEFGSTHSHRQRQCMLHGLCQVCGKRGAELYVIIDDSDGEATHTGLWDDDRLILNAPLHDHCYAYACHVCPHLQRTKPYATVRSSRPLPVVGYTTGMYAVPIQFVAPGIVGRELIVGAT